jgi:hypothetical protein
VDTDKMTRILGTSAASRRTFLKLAAATGTGVALGAQVIPPGARAATDDPATILNTALTGEYLAVTTISNVLANASTLGISGGVLTTIQAIGATEAIHVNLLRTLGAVTTTTPVFSYPSGGTTFTSLSTLASTLVTLETAFVAAYMAAAADFASDARADLAQLAYQIGAVEAEHRALARVLGGLAPFADVAFEHNLFPDVAAVGTFLTNQGFLSPVAGNSFAYSDANLAALLSYAGLLSTTMPGSPAPGSPF